MLSSLDIQGKAVISFSKSFSESLCMLIWALLECKWLISQFVSSVLLPISPTDPMEVGVSFEFSSKTLLVSPSLVGSPIQLLPVVVPTLFPSKSAPRFSSLDTAWQSDTQPSLKRLANSLVGDFICLASPIFLINEVRVFCCFLHIVWWSRLEIRTPEMYSKQMYSVCWHCPLHLYIFTRTQWLTTMENGKFPWKCCKRCFMQTWNAHTF